MASSKEYMEYIMEQLSQLDDVSNRKMMGEYIIYYKGKVIGGIYDDRFLVKPTASAQKLMPRQQNVIQTLVLAGRFTPVHRQNPRQPVRVSSGFSLT